MNSLLRRVQVVESAAPQRSQSSEEVPTHSKAAKIEITNLNSRGHSYQYDRFRVRDVTICEKEEDFPFLELVKTGGWCGGSWGEVAQRKQAWLRDWERKYEGSEQGVA